MAHDQGSLHACAGGSFWFACAADFTGDDLVDFADYLEFLNRYESRDPSADLNQDGPVDFSDYLEFLNHYDAGCWVGPGRRGLK